MNKIMFKSSCILAALLLRSPFRENVQAQPQLQSQQSQTVLSEQAGSSALVIAPHQDGRIFLFHNYNLPLGHGFKVYRNAVGAGWELITDEAVYPVQNGGQLRMRLRENWESISRDTGVDDAQAFFLMMRSGTTDALVTLLTLPELAQAMGALFIDENGPYGQHTAYRIVVVNDLGLPTGKVLESEALLEASLPLPVSGLKADNDGRTVTLSWDYPSLNTPGTEEVFRFRPRFRRSDESRVRNVLPGVLLRTDSNTSFQITFDVPVMNTAYEFWIEPQNLAGQTSEDPGRLTFFVADNAPPAALTGVSGSLISEDTIEITWPASTDMNAAGYHVYRGFAGEEEMMRLTAEPGELLMLSLTDQVPSLGRQYRYAVRVLGQNGIESSNSNIVNIAVPDLRKPEAVSHLDAIFDAETKTVKLQWQHDPDADNFRGYRVLRSLITGGEAAGYAQLSSSAINGQQLSDRGPSGLGFEEGRTFVYGVAVISNTGQVSDTLFTRLQIPVVTPPAPPSAIQAELRGETRAFISWSSSPSLDVTHYRLESHTPEASDQAETLATLPANTRSFTARGLRLSQPYIFAVTAIDSAGNESDVLQSTILIPQRTTPPAPVYNLQVRARHASDTGPARVSLAWQHREAPESVSLFRVYRSNQASGLFEAIAELSSEISRYDDPDGRPGYWYKVYPVGANGLSAREARPVQAVLR